jgi:hypothetical protein
MHVSTRVQAPLQTEARGEMVPCTGQVVLNRETHSVPAGVARAFYSPRNAATLSVLKQTS